MRAAPSFSWCHTAGIMLAHAGAWAWARGWVGWSGWVEGASLHFSHAVHPAALHITIYRNLGETQRQIDFATTILYVLACKSYGDGGNGRDQGGIESRERTDDDMGGGEAFIM